MATRPLSFWNFSRVIRRIGPTKSFSSVTRGSMRCSGGKAFLFATKIFGLPFPRCDLTFRS